MNAMQLSGLTDDQGTPVRWKLTTLLACAALAVSVTLQIASAGAKSERLDRLVKQVENLETKIAVVDRVEVRQEEIFRRLGGVEDKIDKLLERRNP